MQFRLLGPVEIEVAGEVLPVSRRRERCLLAVLLLKANRAVPIGRLADLLWDGDPPDRARRGIHGQISRLRAVLASGGVHSGVTLATVGDGYRMEVDPQAVDAHRFRTLLDAAAQVDDLADRVDRIRMALDLWRGPALENAASAWLRGRLCADLTEQRLAAVEELLSTSLFLGREREVLPDLAQTAAAHPGRENLVALHMRALYQADRKTDALAAYERARAYLADELGLDPGPKLRELHQAILREQVDVPGPPAPAPVQEPAAPVVPRQLPADVAGFAGRSEFLDRLDARLPTGDGVARSIVITAVSGCAGVGKTALAVHWAHRVRDRFPDGQLYVNLRGYDPQGSPVPVTEAVRGFLDALQIPPHRIPDTLDAQVGLYRSLLADRRMLVVLDNARDADQVRPLLPGSAGCLVVATSRNRLSSLVAAEGAHPLALDALTLDEARELLGRRLGSHRVAAEPDAVDEIILSCARLPLALAIVAARAATHPTFALRVLADKLQDSAGSLDALSDDGTSSTNLRAVFSGSYRALGEPAAGLFRLLGLHPGLDFAAPAAASLAGIPVRQVRPLLAELEEAHLVTEHVPGRYLLHDLLRSYAIDLAHTAETAAGRRAARTRMFDYYLHPAQSASLLLRPHRRRVATGAPAAGVVPPDIRDSAHALGWFATEYRSLRAAAAEAARTGFDTRCWQLSWALAPYLNDRGLWREQVAMQRTALAAAQRVGDRAGEAYTRQGLGLTCVYLRDFDAAQVHLDCALHLFGELGDRHGLATVRLSIAHLLRHQERFQEALPHAEEAAELYRRDGDRVAEALALNNAAFCLRLLGDPPRALAYCQRALTLVQDGPGSAFILDTLGLAHHHLGDHQNALACFRRSLALFEEAGDELQQAETLIQLGDTYHAVGDHRGARDAWRQAVAILDGLDRSTVVAADTLVHADAEQVRAKLRQLPAPAA